MQDIYNCIDNIKEKIEGKILHPYLLQYIDSPVIDEDKLLMLVLLMEHANLPESKIHNYALTTMLIQIALDTHEIVTNSKLNESSMKTRQLTVLAGDYYSGLYYKSLAEVDDILMIRTLAEGIKNVNEHKIALYRKVPNELEELMNSVKMIESSLFERLTDYFHLCEWNDVIFNLLFVKRLIEEKNQFIHTGTSVVFEALKKLSFSKSDYKVKELTFDQKKKLMTICDHYIDFAKLMIENGLKKLPYIRERMGDRIFSIINQHQPMTKSFVEEG
ncbi:heptaprenyl diphosphate synthase component 1 [Bacillus sp. 03113]|uniref:heptaprenyl diphosphate synthase component 1 n=1 Tax=Bacillus sp. 03113 TaxID=2578211 RepID=UPI0011425ECF|nr:heptaprenyl diphosphate synthase component 1 [Bacillus sp. 03113]